MFSAYPIRRGVSMYSRTMSTVLILVILPLLICCKESTTEAEREDAIPTSLKLIPESRIVAPGMERGFQALAVYSDDSQKDVTMQSEWSLDDSGIEGIADLPGEKGIVRALAQGDGSIGAVYKGISGSAKLTVVDGEQPSLGNSVSILYLDHSTGHNIWQGGVKDWFDRYNATHKTEFRIVEQAFPKSRPYGWNNYPYDYWNIWVKNGGQAPYLEEPTLEILTGQYQVIVFKHCYPVSSIKPDTGKPDVSSNEKRVENYKLQYEALKTKMRSFPATRFIVWTGAARVKKATSRDEAERARQFFTWVKNDWDEPGDNIFVWDFHELETEGGLYLKDEYAVSKEDSHPNKSFSMKAAPLISKRIVDVIQGKGDVASLTGK